MKKFNFGDNLYRIRKPTGISQDSIALAVGMSQTTYSKIERGKILPPDEEFIIKVAAHLDVPVEKLKPAGWDQLKMPKLVCSLTPAGRIAYGILLAAALYDMTRGICESLEVERPLYIIASGALFMLVGVIFWEYTVIPIKADRPD